jgi:hypothetical protein
LSNFRGEITGIVVMVPSAEAFADHAHVTLIAPFGDVSRFDEPLLDRLRDYFATVVPFDFRLTAVREVPDGIVYLAPEPAQPFRKLTEALAGMFPEYPPYQGMFDEIIPHCTIEPDRRQAAAGALPIEEQATRAHLVHARTENDWRWVATFPFAPRG